MAAPFDQMVMEYSTAHTTLAALRKRATELRTDVLTYMRDNGIDECGMPGGTRLVRKRTKKTEGLKKEHIAGDIRNLVGSDAATDETVNNIYARRVTGESETLALVRGESAPRHADD